MSSIVKPARGVHETGRWRTLYREPALRPTRPCPAERHPRVVQRSSVDSLTIARARAIAAHQELMEAIRSAELRYAETAELGVQFDRRVQRIKLNLRAAGYAVL